MTTSYPLRQIEIDGFRGFRNFTLPDLGGVNVLVGGNNSGKTSVLEAISILSSPIEPESWLKMIHLRDPGGIDESKMHSLRWCFHRAVPFDDTDDLVTAKCEFRVKGAFHLERLIVDLKEFYGEPDESELNRLGRSMRAMNFDRSEIGWRGADLTHESHWSQLIPDNVICPPVSLRIWNDLPAMRYAKARKFTPPGLVCEALYPYSYQMNSLQVKKISRLKSSDGAESDVDLLRQFDPDVLDIDIRSNSGYRPAIYLSHRRLGNVPLSIFGDAMRRSVLLSSTLSGLPPGGVLLLDEAEAGIHAGAQPEFFRWLITAAQQKQVQVFLTTHSLEAVDALLSGLPEAATEDSLVVFKLERDDQQGVHAKRLAGDLLHRLRFNRGLDIR
ncbi:AAA family ATPase [Sphaerotilus sp.]|uniref:AAA family ATPase n=1 Tax=Sphaerotilus sp. TaxID=2093942 RepID=UPI002ACD89BF|nr:AAA family ATPase [Sphaerotilus sp.]MDZ7854601.1 AAA family ATPase [Sphaerotilus sp.]